MIWWKIVGGGLLVLSEFCNYFMCEGLEWGDELG